jgi:hypothetical protein
MMREYRTGYIAWGLFMLGLTAAVFLHYERTRPHLAARSQAEWLKLTRIHMQEWYGVESRPSVAAARSYFLDYPNAKEADLHVRLALHMAALPGADLTAAGNEVERAALLILNGLGARLQSARQEFEKAGFTFENQYRWPPSFLVSDIDGDGKQDVVFACPGQQASFCFLFRQTGHGWASYRFGTGLPVMGLKVFDITPHGPKVIAVMSMADSEYSPSPFFDAFAWRNNGLRSVLSTTITNGWQWDFIHVDGADEIRLFGHAAPVSWRDNGSASPVVTRYRWNGAEYIMQPETRTPTAIASAWSGQGNVHLAEGRVEEARVAFR